MSFCKKSGNSVCTNEDRILNLNVGEHLGDSDHNNIRFEILLETLNLIIKE